MRWFTLVLLGGIAWGQAPAQKTDLNALYQQEFSFLEAEKKALDGRLKQLQRETRSAVQKAEGKLTAMERQIVALRDEATAIEAQLAEAERADTGAEQAALVLETIERAREALPAAKLPAEATPDVLVKAAFAAAADDVVRGGQLVREPGAFFDRDGTAVEGELIKIGRVATYGIADRAAGVLAPAGAERLRLWSVDTAAAARAIAGGSASDTLPIFVHESLAKPVTEKVEKTALEIVQSGGVIAWVIVGLGALAGLLLLVRIGVVLWSGRGAERLGKTVLTAVSAGEVDGALEACQRKGPAGRVLAKAVSVTRRGALRADDAVGEVLMGESARVARFSTLVTVAAAVAPLLGLLGTVTGMISTFDIITEHGTGDPKLLSGGISEALVTTELGLIVAIPTLFLGNLINGRAEVVLGRLERAAMRVMNAMVDGEPPAAPPTPQPEAAPRPVADAALATAIVLDR